MNRVFEPDESLFEQQWPPTLHFRHWPNDFRKFMFWSFAGTSVGFLALALFRLSHLRNASTLALLIGPIFEVNGAALCGIAAWALWKALPSARGWAIAASLLYLSLFFRQFLVPAHVVWFHNLFSLGFGSLGLAVFLWPDRNATLSDPGSTNLSGKPTNRHHSTKVE